MDKRALTCYDTRCSLDQLSFAQEMRESLNYAGVDTSEAQRVQAPQEESDEKSRLRPSFHPASDPDANH
jgi:hypothetical protein